MRPVNSKEVKNDRLGVLHCRNVLPSGFCTVSIQKIALSVVALALFTTKGMLPMLPLGAGIAIVAPGSAPGGIAVAGAVTLTDAVEMTSTVVWIISWPSIAACKRRFGFCTYGSWMPGGSGGF